MAILRYRHNQVFSPIKFLNLSLTIHTKGLVKRYRNRTVANKVSIEVRQGEIVGLLGPNGAGKTTTFYMVVGFVQPDEGEVYLADENITKMPMYKRAQKGIGYLPPVFPFVFLCSVSSFPGRR